MQKEGLYNSLALIKNEINKYDLSKTNEKGYKEIRDYYNKGNKEWYIFYAMLTHSFNYQIRFNKKGEYNMPFGKNKSYFNASLEKHFIEFIKAMENKNIVFTNKNFEDLKINKLTNKDFVYLDPPYLITCASYNEQNGWNVIKENKLLQFCDSLNERGTKFALSNVLEHKGEKNKILINLCKKYNVHYLNYNYNNCNYQENNKDYKTLEVLITNY